MTNKQNKQAILVVSFGTSYAETLGKTIAAVEKDIAAAFPAWEIRRAFTSGRVIAKIAAQTHVYIDSVEQALERLAQEGFETVVCQPTHILNGYEHDDMVAAAAPFLSRFQALVFGAPLLTSHEDYQQVAAALQQELPLSSEEALVLMGHGTTHFADSAYATLEYVLHQNGMENAFVGTLEGYPHWEALLKRVKNHGAKKVVLTPFLLVAGDHACNDMASDEPDSWKSLLAAEGLEVRVVLKGLGEYDSIRKIYLAHAAKAVRSATH